MNKKFDFSISLKSDDISLAHIVGLCYGLALGVSLGTILGMALFRFIF